MKIEVIITVWDYGLFKLRDRIEANSFDSLEEQFEVTLTSAREKLAEIERKKYAIAEDDDIPF